jgi:hypothetical protein
MISAERLVELRAKVKKEMARRSCVEHGSSASMNKLLQIMIIMLFRSLGETLQMNIYKRLLIRCLM